MSKNLHINSNRLIQRLMEMAQIGATPRGGVCRVALSNADKAGRDLFVGWCQAAGCTVNVDQVGNIFARRPGTRDDLLPVLTGSHLDSQPTGGKYDGAFGVLAALEVIETLNDEQVETSHPIEIVSWTNEEGARFAPGLTGSGVFVGEFDLDQALSLTDKDGHTFGEELKRIGYAGETTPGQQSYHAAIELHIEQGPVLEAENITIGVVRGIQGMQWYDIILEGQEAHAGTTPMDQRHDPMLGAIRVMQRIFTLNQKFAPDGRVTFGDVQIHPGSRNTVPGRVIVTLDFRHPQAAVLDQVDRQVRSIVEQECRSADIQGQVKQIWYMPPVFFAEECIKAVQSAANRLNCSSKSMISGAGHDAMYLAKVTPTGMIFVPCKDGLSHNELEYTAPEDLVDGCNVLLYTVLELANS
ncbi:MAG: Zn-dependent hydrolase [Anaerolineales bacterium]|jgi:N-carbamoyl-L-amino-acid hydrolase